MNAKKELYILVKTAVKAIPIVKHWDYWNDNILQDGDQKPFPTPAVFFEYGPITWDPSTAGNRDNESGKLPEQSGTGGFTLHVVHKKIDSSDIDASELAHFDEVDEIVKAVHMIKANFLNGPVQRERDEQILTHGVLRDAPVAFTANLWDAPVVEDDLAEVDPVGITVETEVEKPYTGPGKGISIQIKGNES